MGVKGEEEVESNAFAFHLPLFTVAMAHEGYVLAALGLQLRAAPSVHSICREGKKNGDIELF